MGELFAGRSHLGWVLAAVVALAVVFLFTDLVGTFFAHVLIWAFVAGTIYYLDYHYLRFLGPQTAQFTTAVILAVVGIFVTSRSLFVEVPFAIMDVVIIMCVFSVSAKIWPNAEMIQQRFNADPLGAARDGLQATVGAVRDGVTASGQEVGRIRDHFSSTGEKV